MFRIVIALIIALAVSIILPTALDSGEICSIDHTAILKRETETVKKLHQLYFRRHKTLPSQQQFIAEFKQYLDYQGNTYEQGDQLWLLGKHTPSGSLYMQYQIQDQQAQLSFYLSPKATDDTLFMRYQFNIVDGRARVKTEDFSERAG